MTEKGTTITYLSWGRMEVAVDGRIHQFRDCKVWPGGAVDWDWTETGTHHEPGIQPADIQEVLDHDADVVVLSEGMRRRLRAAPETEDLLRSSGIEYYVTETRRAVELFNELSAQGKRVGGVFHSTC